MRQTVEFNNQKQLLAAIIRTDVIFNTFMDAECFVMYPFFLFYIFKDYCQIIF